MPGSRNDDEHRREPRRNPHRRSRPPPSWSGSPPRSPSTTAATTRRTRRRSPTPNTMRCACATPRSRRAFPSWCAPDSPSLKVGAAPSGTFGPVAPRPADAVAGQRLLRRGRARFRRRRPPLPRLAGRRAARLHRRAEDRRPVDVAALRARPAGHGGDPRRRHDRRERHRQHPHHPRDPAATAEGRAGRRRDPRRGLYAPRRFPGAQRAHGGERPGLRQSAQFGGRQPAPARPRGDHAPGR